MRIIGEWLSEKKFGIGVYIGIPALFTVVNNIRELSCSWEITISALFLSWVVFAELCRHVYRKSLKTDMKLLNIKKKIISSLTTIREQRFEKIREYLEGKYKGDEFAEIITDPWGQMKMIKNHFKDIVLDFFEKSDTGNVFSNLAYKMKDDMWRWAGDGKTEYTAEELAKDPRSTFFSVINGLHYEFHPVKKDVDNVYPNENKKAEKAEAELLPKSARRYLRTKNDGKKEMLGSIICKHIVLSTPEGETYIEAVLIFHTSSESLTANIAAKELCEKERVLEHDIVNGFEQMLKVELALFYMKEKNEKIDTEETT